MPRKPSLPSYRLHKARNCAAVRIDGRDHYLGKFNSPESYQKYARLIAEWKATSGLANQSDASRVVGDPEVSVAELSLAYWKFAKGYYVKDGQPTGQVTLVKSALHYLQELYSGTRAVDFGPLALQAAQEHMVAKGLSRPYINGHTRRIRLMFRWAASKELIPATVYQSLVTVDGLKKGRTTAREPDPIGPVLDEVVEATLPHLPVVVADMVRIQRLTGCRPGEICKLRPCDVDRSGEVWIFRPVGHKMTHHDRDRAILIGPKAQAILLPYLLRDAQAYCFSAFESETERKAIMRENRKTPVQPSHRDRSKPQHKGRVKNRYVKDTYSRAIVRAVDLALGRPIGPVTWQDLVSLVADGNLGPSDVIHHAELKTRLKNRGSSDHVFSGGRSIRAGSIAELFPADRRAKPLGEQLPKSGWHYMTTAHRWAPNQLRHAAATELRSKYGIEAAQLALGHSKPDTSLIYAERDLVKAAEIMKQVG